jgi:hypothetical protein
MSSIGDKKEKEYSEVPPSIVIVDGQPFRLNPEPHPNCNVMELQSLAFTINDADRRRQAALSWLRKHGPDCRNMDLKTITNNSSNWLGTSHNIEVTELLYKLYHHTKRPVNPLESEESVTQRPLNYRDKK